MMARPRPPEGGTEHLPWSRWFDVLADRLTGDPDVSDPLSELGDDGLVSFFDGRASVDGGTAALRTVVWSGDNGVARPSASTVYWKGWPDDVTPVNALPGDLVFSPDVS